MLYQIKIYHTYNYLNGIMNNNNKLNIYNMNKNSKKDINFYNQ